MYNANFPYDVQWTDIDAMGNYLDFTYDTSRFHGLPVHPNPFKVTVLESVISEADTERHEHVCEQIG